MAMPVRCWHITPRDSAHVICARRVDGRLVKPIDSERLGVAD